MTDLTTMQTLTCDELHKRFKGNEITGRKLAIVIGLVDKNQQRVGAEMRAVIGELRKKGFPICASSSGYYWAASPGELREYLESFPRRIEEQYEAMRGMAANRAYEQVEIIEI